ncbi:unnamed protein product [Meloidogyne enterolobii]|uniref:Uncharacterized protein n=7 Tax=Meloidogyne TaxID=189290 RepID=A0A6V7WXJ7_MELEN|nr:unnamed protein product [Meloidogyne enterolobii]CAD2191673.1 unnamed protein product [Meloidogyne enterolobii]CAD2195721.1 unnamed protein product [Meloidogyne enterolobii]CAD2203198.1 unnamed protein product [Meloidogyne enterolobii]
MNIQRQLKEDWDNRELEYSLVDNVRQIAEFISHFELSCKSKLAALNDSITSLERKVEFLEAAITRGETLH